MIIKKANRERHENSKKCMVYTYPFDEKDVNLAYSEINGRYPDEGQVMNDKVKEMILVIDGRGKIVIEDEEIILEKGDEVLIQPGKKFYYKEGNLKIVIACAPAWYPEQYKEIK